MHRADQEAYRVPRIFATTASIKCSHLLNPSLTLWRFDHRRWNPVMPAFFCSDLVRYFSPIMFSLFVSTLPLDVSILLVYEQHFLCNLAGTLLGLSLRVLRNFMHVFFQITRVKCAVSARSPIIDHRVSTSERMVYCQFMHARMFCLHACRPHELFTYQRHHPVSL